MYIYIFIYLFIYSYIVWFSFWILLLVFMASTFQHLWHKKDDKFFFTMVFGRRWALNWASGDYHFQGIDSFFRCFKVNDFMSLQTSQQFFVDWGTVDQTWPSGFKGLHIKENGLVKVKDYCIVFCSPYSFTSFTLPETNIAPENGWLEY